ncbi:MAG: leucine-rich repeat protein [Paludibacteraceae bacterium]
MKKRLFLICLAILTAASSVYAKVVWEETFSTRRGSTYVAKVNYAWPYASQWFTGYNEGKDDVVEGNQYDNDYTNVSSYCVSIRNRKLNGDDKNTVGIYFSTNRPAEQCFVRFEGGLPTISNGGVLKLDVCAEDNGGTLNEMIITINNGIVLNIPATTLGDRLVTSTIEVNLPSVQIDSLKIAFNNAPSQRFISKMWMEDGYLVCNDGIYFYLDTANQTAEVTANPIHYTGDITIPTHITHENVIYSVVGIGVCAFINSNNLTSITMESETPISVGDRAFEGVNCPFYVPCGSMEAYKVAWSEYASRITYSPSQTCIFNISTTSANPEWGATDGDTTALYLDTVSISAIPNYGYHFVKWDGDDIIDNSITVATAISIASELPTNSESDIYTIVGYVVGKYNYYDNLLYKIADTPNGGNTFLIYTGSQSVSIGDYISITGHIYKSSDLQYAYGDTQQVSFIKITNNLYNVVVKKNATYEAVFAKNVYSITKNAEHGSISGNSSAEYLDFVTLTVTPDYGYHFTQWSDGNTDNPRVFQITKDTTFTAEFAYDRVGTCGKDLALVWSYDPTKKVLTIGNSGEFTENMQFGVEAPNEMEELVIGNSVTAIGENAFAGISTLKKVTIGESVKTIHNNAFYNCVNLETIFNYRQTPTNAYSTAFDGVDKFECKLYVLPSSIDMYKAAAVWRDFYYTYAIGAVETTVTTNDVTVEPQDNAATVTWPTSNNAATYTIEITKDGEVFCTLIFNGNGQLTGIAFAPGKNGNRHAPAAKMTANGMQFTVTGLNSATHYALTLQAKNDQDAVLASYSSEFTTTGTATAIDNTPFPSGEGRREASKLLHNGQILILCGDKTYTLQGQEVK